MATLQNELTKISSNLSKICTKLSSEKMVNKMDEKLLNDDDVVRVMRRKLGTKDFHVKNWSLDRVKGTNGFLGQYYHLRVTCITNDGNNEKFQYFAKTKPPRDSAQYELATTGNVFKREIQFYEDVAMRMGIGQGPKWKADCYLGKGESIIILEDVTLDGFGMPDKFQPFGYEECILMMKSFARLHARSLILDEKIRGESGKSLNDVYGDIMEEGLFPTEDRTQRNFIDSSIIGSSGLIDLIDCLDDGTKSRLKNLIADWSWRIPKLLRTSDKYRNVICHRDPWANNMMVKRDPTNGRPTGFYLIDFQFIRYSPPAIDIMLSLYLNTRRKTRDENFEEFTKIYHDSVRDELKRENFDIDELGMSWKIFRQSCEHYRNLAIIYVTVNQQIMLMDQESADKYFVKQPELLEKVLWGCGRKELVCPIFSTCREYRERVIENIMEINEKLPESFEE